MEHDNKTQKKRKRNPRKISQTYLENAGLYYLERYSSSSANFRKVMMRKIKRSCEFHKTNVEDFTPLLDKLIVRYQEVGLLNDHLYARGKVESLRRKGLGERAIVARLKEKGLNYDEVKRALNAIDYDKENAELEAAYAYVKRKKLGRYRTREIDDMEKLQRRELASLARAGYSFDIAKKALDFHEDDYV